MEKRTYVQVLASACISLMGLLGATIKYAWRVQHMGKCISLKICIFQKTELLAGTTIAAARRQVLHSSTECFPAQ